MFNTIFGFNYFFDFDYLRLMTLTVALSVYLRFLLSVFRSYVNVRTPQQLFSFFFLPLAGLIITSVISNNIALSLGMVGALSIVRFRTPVKNPSELVLYFILITLGIVVNVNPSLAINFVLFISLLLLVTEIYNGFGKKFLGLSPSQNLEDKSILQVTFSSINETIYELDECKHFSQNENGQYLYIFQSNDINKLNSIKDSFEKDKIISLSIDF